MFSGRDRFARLRAGGKECVHVVWTILVGKGLEPCKRNGGRSDDDVERNPPLSPSWPGLVRCFPRGVLDSANTYSGNEGTKNYSKQTKQTEDKKGWREDRKEGRRVLDVSRDHDSYWRLQINIMAQALFLC